MFVFPKYSFVQELFYYFGIIHETCNALQRVGGDPLTHNPGRVSNPDLPVISRKVSHESDALGFSQTDKRVSERASDWVARLHCLPSSMFNEPSRSVVSPILLGTLVTALNLLWEAGGRCMCVKGGGVYLNRRKAQSLRQLILQQLKKTHHEEPGEFGLVTTFEHQQRH
uniref:Uncharacterized protein n=1 Tax=Timema bartmani TaxID=61472 RepID=A0A7R9I5U9_9NEOP|nr:unnamed protein product [Timema bartmani]